MVTIEAFATLSIRFSISLFHDFYFSTFHLDFIVHELQYAQLDRSCAQLDCNVRGYSNLDIVPLVRIGTCIRAVLVSWASSW